MNPYFDTSSKEPAGREYAHGVVSLGSDMNALLSLENKVQLEFKNMIMNCLEHAVTCDVTPHSQPCLFTQLPP